MVKNLPANAETRVQFLGQEDPLEKEIATHSSILAWEIPWTEEPGGLQSMGLQRVGHDWGDSTAQLFAKPPPFLLTAESRFPDHLIEGAPSLFFSIGVFISFQKPTLFGDYLLSHCNLQQAHNIIYSQHKAM